MIRITIEEASKKYNIPIHILKNMKVGDCVKKLKKIMGSWQYDETDLKILSLIMTLYDLDFSV